MLIENARRNVADFIGVKNINNLNKEIIFTSSGSAANALAISGLMKSDNLYKLYYSPIAHKSMKMVCQEYNGIKIPIKNNGFFDLDKLEKMLIEDSPRIPVICFDVANSEIGNIQDYRTIINMAHKYKGYVVCDATGYIPYYKVNVIKDNIDIMTFSGHKLKSLKGCGVLYKRHNIELEPLIHGSQENGLFGGTENIIGIASLGKAVETYDYSKVSDKQRNHLFNLLSEYFGKDEMYLVGADLCENRLPNNLYICIKGINAEMLVTALDQFDIQVATGSACNNGKQLSADTLRELNMDEDDMNSCIRISLSFNETDDELNYFVNILSSIINILKGGITI